MPGPQAANQPTPEQLNSAQRKAVLMQSVRMKQLISSQTINPAVSNVVNIVPRNVGLITRFILEVSGTVTDTDAINAAVLTDFGIANAITNIQFTDLQNNQRHNTYGFHFALVSAFKERQGYASALTYSQEAMNFAANWPVLQSTANLTNSGGATPSAPFRMVYEIPISYSDDDLRGAIYANVVSNQMNLQLTVNPNPFAAVGDDTFAMYSGATGILTNVTINVYQEYYDQLPIGQTGVVLPILDISTVYQLLYSNFTNIAAGQDFYVQYTNFRRYLSVCAVYNNSGTIGGRGVGGDVNYWALVSANFTNIWKVDPLLKAQETRRVLGIDPPPGVYYFPSRMKPVYTLTYGNMQIDLNPITAGPNAYLLVLWEFLALQNTLSQAGSLPANG